MGHLEDGQAIDLLQTGNIHYGIIVNTPGHSPGSLLMELKGPLNSTKKENKKPFSVFGRLGNDIKGQLLPPGQYTLTLTPYEFDDLSGAKGRPTSIHFSVLAIREVPLEIKSYRLINAKTSEVILEFDDDIILGNEPYLKEPLAIQAITSPSTVGSVFMQLSGPLSVSQIENDPPYSQFAKVKHDFFGRYLSEGDYQLCSQAFSLANLEGYAGEETCVNIRVDPEICPNEDIFMRLNDFRGPARIHAVAFSIQDKGYLGLGETAVNYRETDFWEYEPSTDTWIQVADYPGEGRAHAISFVINEIAYVGLGKRHDQTSLTDFYKYDPSSNSWGPVHEFKGPKRTSPFTFVLHEQAYIGCGTSDSRKKLADVYRYNPKKDKWTQVHDFPFPIYNPQAIQIDDIAYVFGGATNVSYGQKKYSNQLWAYDQAKDLWYRRASHPDPIGRASFLAFSIGKNGYVGLGDNEDGDLLHDFWVYEPAQDCWHSLGEFCGESARDIPIFLIGNHAYFGTGLSNEPGRVYKKDFWKFSPRIEPTLPQTPVCENDHIFTQLGDYLGGKLINGVTFSIGKRGYFGLGEKENGLATREYWQYNPDDDTWAQVANYRGLAREDAAAFVIDGIAYVGVGTNNDHIPVFPIDFWSYNPQENIWTKRANFPGQGRNGTFTFSHDGIGYLGGGQSYGGNLVEDMYAYSPQSDSWKKKKKYPGAGVGNAAFFKIEDDAYVQGAQELWQYNFSLNTWSQKADLPKSEGLGTHIGFSIQDKGYVGLGFDPKFYQYNKEFWEYDPSTDTWKSLGEFCGNPMRGLAGFVIDETAYFGTGQDRAPGKVHRSDFWKFTPQKTSPVIGQMAAYPNPIQDAPYIVLSLPKKGKYTVDLIHPQGKLMKQYTYTVDPDKQNSQLQIPRTDIGDSPYLYVRITHPNGYSIQKILR